MRLVYDLYRCRHEHSLRFSGRKMSKKSYAIILITMLAIALGAYLYHVLFQQV